MRPQAAAMKAPSRPACMDQLSLQHRFPPAVIKHAIWLYLGFTLSYRDVEDLLAGRGLEVPMKRCGAGF